MKEVIVKTEKNDDEDRRFVQSREDVETSLYESSYKPSDLVQHNIVVKIEQCDDD